MQKQWMRSALRLRLADYLYPGCIHDRWSRWAGEAEAMAAPTMRVRRSRARYTNPPEPNRGVRID